MPSGWYDDDDVNNLPFTEISYANDPSKVDCAPNTYEDVTASSGSCNNCGFNIYTYDNKLSIYWHVGGSSSKKSNDGILEIGDYARIKYRISSKNGEGRMRFWSEFIVERKNNEDYDCSLTNWIQD